jgi:hypothetical protein
MKRIFYFFIAGAISLVGVTGANAQTSSSAQANSSDKTAIKMLKDCYKAYNTTWATAKGTSLRKKLDSLRQRYCTDELIQKLKNNPDFDLLGYNPYTDVEHLKTLMVKKEPSDDTYVVSYMEHSNDDSKPADVKITIHVNVAEQPEGLKIASVW